MKRAKTVGLKYRTDPDLAQNVERAVNHKAARLCFVGGCIKKAMIDHNFCEAHLPVPPPYFNARMVAGK